MRQQAISLYPPLADAEVLHTWSGLRPRPLGRPAPIIERLKGYTNVILATGHYRQWGLVGTDYCYPSPRNYHFWVFSRYTLSLKRRIPRFRTLVGLDQHPIPVADALMHLRADALALHVGILAPARRRSCSARWYSCSARWAFLLGLFSTPTRVNCLPCPTNATKEWFWPRRSPTQIPSNNSKSDNQNRPFESGGLGICNAFRANTELPTLLRRDHM